MQLNIIRITKQLEYFQQYQSRVSGLIGEAQTQQLVNQALVLITLGGNDFVNNYYLIPFSARSRQFSLPDYVRYLISEYRKVLLVIIYNLPFLFIRGTIYMIKNKLRSVYLCFSYNTYIIRQIYLVAFLVMDGESMREMCWGK